MQADRPSAASSVIDARSEEHTSELQSQSNLVCRLLLDKNNLVVMDIELPGVSGLALCRLLRAQTATRRLPVIVVSSHDREDYKVEAFAAGADDFVVKSQ